MRTELWTGAQGVSEESLGNFELFQQRKKDRTFIIFNWLNMTLTEVQMSVFNYYGQQFERHSMSST